MDIESAIFAADGTANMTNVEVFMVTEPSKLKGTIAAVASSNGMVVISLSPNVYTQQVAYPITTNIMIVKVSSLTGRRRLGQRGRLLQTTSTFNDAIIVAAPYSRHFTLSGGATILTDGVKFQGAPGAIYSGGIELDGEGTKGIFHNTIFEGCSFDGSGGALLLTNSATADIQSGSQFIGNQASQQGGGISVGTGSSITLEGAVTFSNNSAPRTSAAAGGGGTIYLAAGAKLTLSAGVVFSNTNQNVDSDITSDGGMIACGNPASPTPLMNCATGCTGSYVVPPDCPICSAGIEFAATKCTNCPKGSYGGTEAELSCQLCSYMSTTVYPPSSLDIADLLL
jgi:hypothetical protein